MLNISLERFHLPMIFSAFSVLGGWALFLIVENTLFYLDGNLAGELNTPSTQTPALQSPQALSPSLTTLSLFGQVTDQSAEVVIDAPATRLNLELHGVFLSNLDTASSAIVAERGRDGKLYQIGEKLPGSAVLHAVAADHILLRRGSRVEKLLFISKRLNIKGSTASSRQSLSAATQRQPSSTRSGGQMGDRGSQSGPKSSSILSQVRDRLLDNPNQLLKEYGLSLVSPGSRQGYKVDSAHPAISKTGLQPGDRVVSVNGAPLGVAMNDARLIDQARSAGRVRVEVERGGRRFFLTIPIP